MHEEGCWNKCVWGGKKNEWVPDMNSKLSHYLVNKCKWVFWETCEHNF